MQKPDNYRTSETWCPILLYFGKEKLIMFMTPLTEFEYYWEKAEFQDPVSHRSHVENYKKGIRDSIAFDEQYQKEAEEELKKENEK